VEAESRRRETRRTNKDRDAFYETQSSGVMPKCQPIKTFLPSFAIYVHVNLQRNVCRTQGRDTVFPLIYCVHSEDSHAFFTTQLTRFIPALQVRLRWSRGLKATFVLDYVNDYHYDEMSNSLFDQALCCYTYPRTYPQWSSQVTTLTLIFLTNGFGQRLI